MSKIPILLVSLVAACVVALVVSHRDSDNAVELVQVLDQPKSAENSEVYNSRGEKLALVLPVQHMPAAEIEQYSVETRAVLERQVKESAFRAGKACSGANFDAKACSMWWSQDVTVYDMSPPHGVIRSRPEWEKRLSVLIKEEPHDEMQINVESTGFVGGGTNYAWANGYWAKFKTGKINKRGRYSAVLQESEGEWRYFIFSTIEMNSDADWTPVTNGQGGAVKFAAQKIMNEFAKGYNERNYRLAFEYYSPHAKFPFMKSMGGVSLAFAVNALDQQKKRLSPAILRATVDETKQLGKEGTVAVAHGFQKLTDEDSNIYTMGRFTFLLILERKTPQEPWKVKYDFSPNNWLLGPNTH